MIATGQNTVALRRTPAPHASMFVRMLTRAALLRRGHAAALLAMVVASAAATAMLNLYVDVQAKLRGEFRKYGANIVVVAKDAPSLPPDTLRMAEASAGAGGLAVPFAYAVARTPGEVPLVVVGTDFGKVRKLDSWWLVTTWPDAPRQALIGKRAASLIGAGRRPLVLTFQGRPIELTPVGDLQTGAEEDSRIYISLADFTAWTGLPYSTLEVSVPGTAAQVNAVVERLTAALPGAEVRPVRQVMEGEARVLGKMRSTLLASSLLIILTAAVCVLATLSGWVADRRRDFALMKALGASGRLIQGFFAAEAAVLGAAGAVAGFGLGVGLAMWIGRANFHAPVSPRLEVFPMVLLGAVLIALLAAIVPISLLRRVQPANILRGE